MLLHTGTTVWVAMRARLWKCNVDQVRPASATEAVGVEVKDMCGKRAGAVDVAKEGTPPEDTWRAPVAEEEPPPRVPSPEEAEAAEPSPPVRGEELREARVDLPPPRASGGMPRRISIESTTVPSEASEGSHPEAPHAKKSRIMEPLKPSQKNLGCMAIRLPARTSPEAMKEVQPPPPASQPEQARRREHEAPKICLIHH